MFSYTKHEKLRSFSLFDNEWNSVVSSIDSSIASIRATANDGSTIDYIFDGNLAFFSSFSVFFLPSINAKVRFPYSQIQTL